MANLPDVVIFICIIVAVIVGVFLIDRQRSATWSRVLPVIATGYLMLSCVTLGVSWSQTGGKLDGFDRLHSEVGKRLAAIPDSAMDVRGREFMQTVRAAHGYMGEIAGDFNPMGWNVEYRWGIFPVFRSGHVAANLMLLADIPASLAWARTVMVFEQHKWDTFSQRNRDQKWIKRTHMIGYSKDMMGNLGNTLKGCVDKLRRPNLLISNSNDPRSASSRLIAETSRAVALALKTQAVQTTVFDDIDMTKTLTVTEVHPAGSGWHELSPFLLDMRPLSLSPFLLFPYEIRWVDDRPRVGTEMMVHLVTCDVVGSWPHGVSGVGSARTFSVIGSVGAAFVPGSRFTRPAHSVLPELSGILLRRFRESRVAFFPVKLVNTK